MALRLLGQTASMSDRVTCTIDGGVADVRLNRPDKMNALDPAMFAAIDAMGERLKNEPGLRAVVLSGEGRAFCAGLDFGTFQVMAGGGDGSAERVPDGNAGLIKDGRITHVGQQVCWVWQELEVPVIAAVHGVALGGGIQIALGADIRIVSPDVRMSVLEIRWGLVPDMTGTLMLSRLVRPDVAKELAMTGRMVDGEEAVRIGLATRVAQDPYADAMALAREIAGKSPQSVRGIKHLVEHARHARPAEQFAEERRVIGALIGSPNQREAVTAYFEKRDPVFAD
ncbi:MAG: crotonase/enoyl-CoA hydratase family protein [Acidimicrobiales bacterium]